MYRFRAIAAAAIRSRARRPERRSIAAAAVFFKHASYERSVFLSRGGLCSIAEKPPAELRSGNAGEVSSCSRDTGTGSSQPGKGADSSTEGANEVVCLPSPDVPIVMEAVANFLHKYKNLTPENASLIATNAGGFASRILDAFRKAHQGAKPKALRKQLDAFLPKMNVKINEFEVFFESVGLDLETARSLSRERVEMISLLTVTSYLQGYGVERSSVGTILDRCRILLEAPLEEVVKNVTYLEELGIEREDLPRILTQAPELLRPELRQRCKAYMDLLAQHQVRPAAVKRLVKHFSGHISRLPHVFFVRGLTFLHKELNMADADVGRILRNHPEALLLDFHRTLAAKVEFLQDYRIKGEDITRIFCRCPSIVGYSIDTLQQKVDYLRSVGVRYSRMRKVLVAYPAILATSIENKMKPAVACAQSFGITGYYLRRLITKRPAIFAIDVKVKLPMVMESLKDLGPQGMVLAMTWGIAEGIGAMQQRVRFLKSLGFLTEDVVRMLDVDPRILKISKYGMQEKVKYLTKEMGMRKDILITNPTFLYSHFERRIKLRYEVLLMLHQKGVLPKPPELTQILSPSNQHFMERYVNPFPECLSIVRRNLQAIERTEMRQKALMLQYSPEEKQKRAEHALAIQNKQIAGRF